MSTLAKRRLTPIRLVFLVLCAPPVVYAVMGMGTFIGRAGPDWTGLGMAGAMIAFVLLALMAFARGRRVSAAVLLFAAYAPLVLAIVVTLVLRFV